MVFAEPIFVVLGWFSRYKGRIHFRYFVVCIWSGTITLTINGIDIYNVYL